MFKISYIILFVNDDGICNISVMLRDSIQPFYEVLEIFDRLSAAPALRTDFGHSGDKAAMDVVFRRVPNVEGADFCLKMYFEANSIRYEFMDADILLYYGRADAYVIKKGLRILASGSSLQAYLQEHGEFEFYKD